MHDYEDDDRGPRRPARGRYQCPYCGSQEVPVTKQRISTAGWAVFIALLFFCFPLFWIGLLIKEDYLECYDCGTRIGG